MLLFGEFVEGETELLLSPFEFALGWSGLEPGISTEKETESRACDEYFSSDRVGASEIGGDSQDVVHAWLSSDDFYFKIYFFIKLHINN